MIRAQQELSRFRWLLMLLVPALAICLNLVMFGWRYLSSIHLLVFSTLLLLLIIALLSAFQILIANFIRRRQKVDSNTIGRMLLAACIHFPVTAGFISIIFLLYDFFGLFQYHFSKADFGWAVFSGIICDIIGIAMNEGIYSYHKWRETKLEAEQLSKEKLQTQLNGLLQQINPHFLFNSLNTLSQLVTENPNGAQKYISDMSRVYRYLLRTNDHELTTLANELQFIESYFHLLQTRFGKGVEMTVNVQPVHTSLLLPPLTLQLLVENAVKHNTVGKNKPLRIEISATDTLVTVKNNLQKKSIRVESGKVGLSNIAEKYRLINKSSISVSDQDGFFTVSVPLLVPAET